MYIIVIISLLIALSLIGKVQKHPLFSIEKTNALKAVLPFIIILGHCSLIFGGCGDFTKTGALVVAIFFFISGYGLQVKYENYQLNFNYIKGRIVKLLLPILFLAMVYSLLLYYIDKNNFVTFYTNFKSWNILLPFTWFVTKLIVLYICFLYSTYEIKLHLSPLIRLLIFVVILDIILIILDAPGHLYISDCGFICGVLFRRIERKIISYTILLTNFCLVFALLLMPFSSNGYVYIIIITVISATIPMLLCNLSIKSFVFIRHLSSISYDLYLCQGIAFLVVRQISTDLMMLYLLVFGITYMLAIVNHKVTRSLFAKYLK